MFAYTREGCVEAIEYLKHRNVSSEELDGYSLVALANTLLCNLREQTEKLRSQPS